MDKYEIQHYFPVLTVVYFVPSSCTSWFVYCIFNHKWHKGLHKALKGVRPDIGVPSQIRQLICK